MNIILENLYVSRELFSSLVNPICLKYRLTSAELLVLLFLANNAEYDTAKDIVNKLKIAKSHVSISVRALEERGYLKGSYEGHNLRTIHLQLCDTAKDIVADALSAQEQFQFILGQGFTEEEFNDFKRYVQKMNDNINAYLEKPASAKAK